MSSKIFLQSDLYVFLKLYSKLEEKNQKWLNNISDKFIMVDIWYSMVNQNIHIDINKIVIWNKLKYMN